MIYRDETILAVNKTAGLPSGPTKDPRRPHAQALVEAAAGERLTLLHRLDRDTTGVLLFARTPEAAERMLAAFRGREVEKVYLALVSGRTQPAFEDVCHLREAPGSRVEVVRSGGMRAETSFRTLAFAEGHSLVEARPRTGRMHQIRVQLARLGHPIVGDALYGGAAAIRVGGREVAVPRQMLHALRVGFPHPGREELRSHRRRAAGRLPRGRGGAFRPGEEALGMKPADLSGYLTEGGSPEGGLVQRIVEKLRDNPPRRRIGRA